MVHTKGNPGEILAASSEEGLIVGTGDGAVEIVELQFEGKKRMPSKLYFVGNSMKVGTKLGE